MGIYGHCESYLHVFRFKTPLQTSVNKIILNRINLLYATSVTICQVPLESPLVVIVCRRHLWRWRDTLRLQRSADFVVRRSSYRPYLNVNKYCIQHRDHSSCRHCYWTFAYLTF